MYLYIFEVEYNGTWIEDRSVWAESQLEGVDILVSRLVAEGYERSRILLRNKV